MGFSQEHCKPKFYISDANELDLYPLREPTLFPVPSRPVPLGLAPGYGKRRDPGNEVALFQGFEVTLGALKICTTFDVISSVM